MANYLAIDFGTTNCMAAVVNDIDGNLELKIIPLDLEKNELSSSIFLKYKYAKDFIIDEDKIANLVEEEKNKLEKQRRELIEIAKRELEQFKNRNEPRVKDPKRKYSRDEIRAYKWVEKHDYENSKLLFHNTEYKLEEERVLSKIPKVSSEELLRQKIKALILQKYFSNISEVLSEKTFFTSLQDPEFIPLFGREAIDTYTKNPHSGFFMRSPKSFLAVDLQPSQVELFTRVIHLILSYIKNKSEAYCNSLFDGVVIGRPVNFMGANSSNSNNQAIKIIRDAAIRSGFDFIRFVEEPLAASLPISKNILSSEAPALIIDIGGGTTDIAFIKVDTNNKVKLKVIKTEGQRIGGNDFDEKIAIKKFFPFLGIKKTDATPLLNDAISTRDIHKQAKFRKCGDKVLNLLKDNLYDDDINRLFQLYCLQLQNQILISSENLKIKISNSELSQIDVQYFKPEFALDINEEEFYDINEKLLNLVEKIIFSCIPDTFKDIPVRLYLTGGMSNSNQIYLFIKKLFPESKINKLPALTSIVAGLAIVARQLKLSSGTLEPDNIRGIPILK